MRFGLMAALLLPLACYPQTVAPHLLSRLAEEAESFGRMATQIIGKEAMEHVSAVPPPRFRRTGETASPVFRTTRIVSEYGFTYFKDDPGNLHELRQVVAVNGKTVKAPGKLRETLALGLKGDTDRLKKKLVQEFQNYGMKNAATDFGQLLLMFQKRQLPNFDFRDLRREYVGADRVVVAAFSQKDGDAALTVFDGKQVLRHKLEGEIALRESDGIPLRILLRINRTEKDIPLLHTATVHYDISQHGFVLPVSLTYIEKVNGKPTTQMECSYSDFKLFGASSEVKFTVEETPPAPPTKK